MQEILSKYGSYSAGLFLLNLPTGFGKTYEVLKYIQNNHKEKRKIYFVTNLKKNLPIEELRELFINEGLENEFNEQFIFIDGTSVKVIENIALIKIGESEVTKWDEWKKLRKKTWLVNNFQKSVNPTNVQIEANKIVLDEIRTELEPKFRTRLINFIDRNTGGTGQYSSPEKKFNWVQEHAPWIIELYPSITSFKKRIFFLSVDKFFAKNVTLIQPSYYFHDHKTIENALVFIDEFDASKKPILNSIIDNGLLKRIDLVALFQQLYTSLISLEFPSGLLLESSKRVKNRINNEGGRTIEEILEHLKNESTSLTKEFHLDAPFKTVDADNRRNFIFHDFEYQTILKESYNTARLYYDGHEQVNYIRFTNKDEKSGASLLTMLARLRSFITFFSKGIRMVSINYCELKEDQGSKGFPLESAFRTVLDLFNLTSIQTNYILDIVSHQEPKVEIEGLPKSNYLREQSFYMNGFRYYDFVDGDNHDLTSRIYLNAFELTPERLILKLSQKANVIGISATATIPTAVGNYDLNFLKERLDKNYRTIDDVEHRILKKRFDKLTTGYSNLQIETDLIHSEYTFESTMEVFQDKNFVKELMDVLEWNNPNKHYYISRYLRAATVYKDFLNNDNCKSFIYLGNALPKSKNESFDKDILHRMFSFLINKLQKRSFFSSENSFFIIDSDQFDQKKELFLEILSKGYKLFVMSTYQTIGAGQNLQYPVPTGIETVRVNNRHQKNEQKDIDGIYCEKPTHLLVNKFNKTLNEKELVLNIFEVEFLAETGEISTQQAKHEIKVGFELISGRKRKQSHLDLKEKNLYSRNSFAQHISKIIIQAIGRISRTNIKNPLIRILAHDELNGLLRKDQSSYQIYLKEYEALLENCLNPEISSLEEMRFNIAKRNDSKSKRVIWSMLNKDFEENNKQYWERLRDFVIRNPRVSDVRKIPIHLRPFYFQLPDECDTYAYRSEGDLYLKTNDGKKRDAISEYGCRLSEFMKIPELKSYFESEGYATDFNNGSYILTPTGYKSIYKGMLGETIGKYLIEKYCYVTLNPLDLEEYELFDFKTSSNIYIDFKHWYANNYSFQGNEHDDIYRKIDRVKAEKALIVNLIGSSAYKPIRTEKIVEIPYLIEETSLKINKEMIAYVTDELAVELS